MTDVVTSMEQGDRWRLRLIATAATLLLAAGIYFIQRLPAAISLTDEDDQELTATRTQTLALYNLRAGQALQYDGALGAGLGVTVSTGRLTPATRTNIGLLGITLPNVKGGHIQWQGKPPPDGRISVRIKNGRQSPDAGLMLQATGSGNIFELNIRAVQTALVAQIDIAAQGDQPPTAELRFAGSNVQSPALAFAPMQIEIPPGEYANLTFENEEALEDSSFRLGELLDTGGTATALPVGRAVFGRRAENSAYPRLRTVVRGVCAAPAGKLLFTNLTPSPDQCKVGKNLGEDNLFASEITIEPRKVSLALEGSGFLIENGRAKPAAFWSALMTNPVIAALMGGLVFAIVRPLWKLWTGRGL
jgi:hypothetical protein